MTTISLQITKASKLTNKGWLRDFFGRGCDEWHNPSVYLIIPFVGMFVLFNDKYPRWEEQHIYYQGPEGIEGAIIKGCAICEEILDEFQS